MICWMVKVGESCCSCYVMYCMVYGIVVVAEGLK